VFILIIFKFEFLMKRSLVPVCHVLCFGRSPRVHWYLGAKLISTHVFLCTKLISSCACSISTRLTQFGIY